jgi:hypothetical protein
MTLAIGYEFCINAVCQIEAILSLLLRIFLKHHEWSWVIVNFAKIDMIV